MDEKTRKVTNHKTCQKGKTQNKHEYRLKQPETETKQNKKFIS